MNIPQGLANCTTETVLTVLAKQHTHVLTFCQPSPAKDGSGILFVFILKQFRSHKRRMPAGFDPFKLMATGKD